MRKRTAARALCCALAALAPSATAAFVAPAIFSSPHRTLPYKHTRIHSQAPRVQLAWPAASTGIRRGGAAGERAVPGLLSVRRRPRSRLTAPSMTFGGGFGGGGGGGRSPKGPLGINPGALVSIAFALLFVFAPGVIFGAFNTIFLAVTIGPLLLSLGFNIYNKINMVDAPCPVCGVELEGVKNKQNQCPSCGAMLIANNGVFEALGSGYVRDETGRQQEFTRMGDSGVIDVDAIDVDD